MSFKDIEINRKEIKIFASFDEADEADKLYWQTKTPAERLEALELMRQSAYGYEPETACGLQRVLEIVKGK